MYKRRYHDIPQVLFLFGIPKISWIASSEWAQKRPCHAAELNFILTGWKVAAEEEAVDGDIGQGTMTITFSSCT